MLDPSKQPGLDVDQSSVDPANAPTDQERLANGPLYLSADLVMRAAQKLSLVEWFKLVGWSIRRAEKQDDRRRIANWAIDVGSQLIRTPEAGSSQNHSPLAG